MLIEVVCNNETMFCVCVCVCIILSRGNLFIGEVMKHKKVIIFS
jgi:hypothetical protein